MRFVFSLIVLLTISTNLFAGGKIIGKVTDEKTGEPLIGVFVIVKNTDKGASTDVEGRYSIDINSGEYLLEFRYLGYKTKVLSDVVVKEGETTTANVLMPEEGKTNSLSEVVVTATRKKESVNSLYVAQKNNVAVSSGISADIIQRSPDRNTGEVLKRVSGASIRDNKFVIIRGLSDRYNAAMINNAQMQSTEPDKKAFSFDIIPSNLIDNIVISKTASPDLPGDFAGGVVQVLTKDVPDDNFINVGFTAGFNTQTTFKDFRSNERGSMTYLGFAGNKNSLPSSFGNDYLYYRGALTKDQRLEAAKQLPNSYPEKTATAMPNSGFQISLGNRTKLKNGGKFGTVVGITHRNSFTILPDFIRGNYTEGGGINFYSTEDQYRYSSNLAAIANFTYVKNKTKITLKNLFNQLYDNTYYERQGYSVSSLQQINLYSSVPSERRAINTQLEGEHAVGKRNIKFVWNLSYSNLNAKQEDLRTAFYQRSISLDANEKPVFDPSAPYKIVDDNTRRYFSELKDNSYGANLSATYPFEMFGQKQNLKVGYLGLYKDRTFEARTFQYQPYDPATFDEHLTEQPLGTIFDQSHLSANGFELLEITNPTDRYDAHSMLNAGFVMFDNSFGDKWRLSWGMRFESYSQTLKAIDLSGAVINKTTVFNDPLPSLNLSYSPNDKTKLRFSASQTVNRPEFREIAPFQFVDYENNWTIIGNPQLKRANITNLDVRYELYPNPGEVITIGGFYKYFQNPIEAVMDDQSNLDLLIFGYKNAPSATAAGLEIDVRKNLSFLGHAKWLKSFTLGGNFTYIHSRVDASSFGLTKDRPLQGQSPYIVNFSCLYNDAKTGLALSALYNRIGERIYIVGNKTIPTTWENSRDVIDLQISKQILKKRAEIKLTIADLLNQPTTFYWNGDTKDGYSDSKDLKFQSYKRGTTFTLGFTYKFAY